MGASESRHRGEYGERGPATTTGGKLSQVLSGDSGYDTGRTGGIGTEYGGAQDTGAVSRTTYHRMHPIRALIIGMLVLDLIGWFASAVALVSYSGNPGMQSMLVNYGLTLFFWRAAETIGVILMHYYADRYPANPAPNFGSFVVTTMVFFSWFADSGLQFAYQAFAHASGTIGDAACSAGNPWCGLNDALGAFDIINFCVLFLMWMHSIYQYTRARWGFGTRLRVFETWTHTFVWIGLLGYIIWTLASIPLSIVNDTYVHSSELNSMWMNNVLHGITIFALTSAAVASMPGRAVGWASAGSLLNFLAFITSLPAMIWIAQNLWNTGVEPNRCPVSGGWSCTAKHAIAAGQGIVMGISLFLAFTLLPYVLGRPKRRGVAAPGREAGEKAYGAGGEPAGAAAAQETGSGYATGSGYGAGSGTGYTAGYTPTVGGAPTQSYAADPSATHV